MSVLVSIRLDRCTAEFLDALGDLVARIDDADRALLEDGIAEANERLKAALRRGDALGFGAE